MGFPCSICRCAGGLGSQFLFNVFQRVLEGGAVPTHFAASRTVFIPKSSDVIVIAKLSSRRVAVAFTATPSDVYIQHRDASRPGK